MKTVNVTRFIISRFWLLTFAAQVNCQMAALVRILRHAAHLVWSEDSYRTPSDLWSKHERIVRVVCRLDNCPPIDLCCAFTGKRSVGLQLQRDRIGFILNGEQSLIRRSLNDVIHRMLGVSACNRDGFGMKCDAEIIRADVLAAHAKTRGRSLVEIEHVRYRILRCSSFHQHGCSAEDCREQYGGSYLHSVFCFRDDSTTPAAQFRIIIASKPIVQIKDMGRCPPE